MRSDARQVAHRRGSTPPPENLFRLEGEYWTLAYDGKTVRVKDVKGLRDIAVLVADRGKRIRAAELTSDPVQWGR